MKFVRSALAQSLHLCSLTTLPVNQTYPPSQPLPRLLQETLQWLADPANLNTDLLPPGLETYDPLPFLSSTGNVFMVTLLPQVGRGALISWPGKVLRLGGCGACRSAGGVGRLGLVGLAWLARLLQCPEPGMPPATSARS